MKIEDVKRNLNQKVMYNKSGWSSEYILTGCILRKNEKSFYYQVELKDPKANSLCYCRLDDISEVNNA